MRLFKHNITFDDILSIVIVLLLILMTRTHQIAFFYGAIGCCLIRITNPLVILPGYFLASLSTSYFSVGDGLGAGRFMSIILLVSFVVSTLREGKFIFSSDYFGIVVLLIVSCIISSLFGPTFSFTTAIQMTINLLLLIFIQNVEVLDFDKFVGVLVLSFALLSASVFFEAVTNSAFLFEERYQGLEVGDEGGTNGNRMAIMLEQCGAMCIAGFCYYKKYIIKALLLACTGAIAFVILATGSRTGLLALLVAVAFSLIIIIGGVNKKKMIVPIILLFVCVFFTVQYLATVDSYILDRFTYSNVAESGGAGRLDGTRVIMTEFFPEHILFGSGIGGGNMLRYQGEYNFPNLCHNIVFDPLSQLGIVIFGLFLYFLIPVFKRISRFVKCFPFESVFVALLVAITVNGIGETIFYEKFFWNDIAICLLCCRLYGIKKCN